jgi:ligand-binding sensor domain-containing protein/signal transduction histidine kinase
MFSAMTGNSAIFYRPLCCLPILAFLVLAGAQNAAAERLPIKSYTVADGLSHDRVKNILRDSRGFLWICTIEGLSRFDGYRFVNYGLEQGLPGGNVSHLLETRSGQYWVATTNGVGRFNASPPTSSGAADVRTPRFTTYAVGNNDQTNNVRYLLEDHAGRLWAGTAGGLFRWVESLDAFQRVEQGLLARPECYIRALAEDAEGSLWIGSNLGLIRMLPDGRLLSFSMRQGGQRLTSTFLQADRDGRLWMFHSKGLLVFRPESSATAASRDLPWLKLTAQQNCVQSLAGEQNGDCEMRNAKFHHPALQTQYLTLAPGEALLYIATLWTTDEIGLALHQTADGQIWIGSHLGLFAFDGVSFRNYTTAQGLNENLIVAVNEDSDGNLWLGGFSSGAMKIVRQGFTSFTKADGVGNLRVVGIHADQTGAVYATSGDWFINQFDGQHFKSVQPHLPSPMPKTGWDFSQCSFQDRNGEWWVPTTQGLYRFSRVERIEQLATARPIAVYTTRDGLSGNNIGHFFEDAQGNLWLGTDGEVQITMWERSTGTFHRYTTADGLPASMAPYDFDQDLNGDIWIGLANGLARYRAGRFTHWTMAEGVPKGIIRNVYCDHAGRLWITSSLGGVGRMDDPSADTPQFKIYTVADGLASNATRCLTEDEWGRIYVGAGRGVDRLDPATGRVKHYTTADGLANSFVNAAFRDRNGHLWFGMLQGLSRLIPEQERPATQVPVWINGLHIAGAAYPISEFGESDISLPSLESSQNRIQIDFFGLGFSADEPLHYQYKLEGAGQDWSEPTEQRTHEMSLGPGSYRFLVRAVRPDSTLVSTPASVSFKILPPIWLRWWFIAITVLVAGSLIYAFARYRYKRMEAVLEAQDALRRSREERFAELERVRKRIATDLHDDIGSSLTQISILSEVVLQKTDANDSHLSGPLSMIAVASRELVDSMSDIVWAINPQKDHLNDLTQRMRRFASDVLTARNIAFEFSAPDEDDDVPLGANIRREVFLIFKESVNNLVRHSGCTEAEIEFRAEPGKLWLKLHDNGRGFDAAQKSQGHGLASMRERTIGLGGELNIISSNGQGTTLTVSIPLKRQTQTPYE